MKLMEDLDGKDVSELYSGMEDEEVRNFYFLFVPDKIHALLL